MLPETGAQTTGRGPSTRSEVAANVTVAPDGVVAAAAMFAGNAQNAGAVVSVIVTVKLPFVRCRGASLALQFDVGRADGNPSPRPACR